MMANQPAPLQPLAVVGQSHGLTLLPVSLQAGHSAHTAVH